MYTNSLLFILALWSFPMFAEYYQGPHTNQYNRAQGYYGPRSYDPGQKEDYLRYQSDAQNWDAYGSNRSGKIKPNSIAKQKLGGILGDGFEGSVNNSVDRSQQTLGGTRNAAAGSNAAGFAGAAMLGAGVPMSMSLFIPRAIAGQQLITMGIMELMQAMASGDAATLNQGQFDLVKGSDNFLRNGVGDASNYSDQTRNDVRGVLADPGFQQFLTQRGINPDAFEADLLGGTLTTPEAIQNYLGFQGNYSSEDLAQADNILQNEFAKVSKIPGQLVDTGDSPLEKLDSGTGGVVTGLNNGRDAASASDSQAPTDLGQLGQRGPASVAASSAASNKGNPSKSGAAESPFSLSQFFQHGKATPFSGALAGLSNSQLLRLGIEKARPSQNIFFLAHRHYRTYRDWRDRDRFATR